MNKNQRLDNYLLEASTEWKTKSPPAYKVFQCDMCKVELKKAYHVWKKFDKKYEFHLCPTCKDLYI